MTDDFTPKTIRQLPPLPAALDGTELLEVERADRSFHASITDLVPLLPAGPQGPQGERGPEGPQGPQGERGPVGDVTPEAIAARDAAQEAAASAQEYAIAAAESAATADGAAQARVQELRNDLADPTGGAGLVAFRQAGEGSVPRTVLDKLREIVSDSDFGAPARPMIQFGAGAGSGRNVTVHPDTNAIAADLSAATIAGGGSSSGPNLIGFRDFLDTHRGDGATNEWVTTFDATQLANIRVSIIRADGVRVTVTADSDISLDGTRAKVVYPKPGHFVNDGPGGGEGSNPFLLSSQRILISISGYREVSASLCDYSGILYGYDNVISSGVMQSASGAHQRIVAGDHNTIFGGSYHRVTSGSYGAIVGGTGTWLEASGSGSVAIGANNSRGFGLGPVFILGGSGHSVAGSNAAVIGSGHTVNANGALAVNRNNTNTGTDSFVGGSGCNVGAVYSSAIGFQCSVSGAGYASAWGRSCAVTAQYATAKGYLAVGRCIGGDYLASGSIQSPGDAQGFVVHVKGRSTNATPLHLTVGNGSQFISGADQGAMAFCAIVTAFEPASGDCKYIELKGLVRRAGGVTSIIGSIDSTTIAETAAASGWSATATISASTAGFRIQVTGEAAKTINWSARVQVSEVG